MLLQLDRPFRWQRFAAVPVVLQRDVVHHQFAVELYCHLVALHRDVEGVPFADGFVDELEGVFAFGIFVVPEAAGAEGFAEGDGFFVFFGEVPDLKDKTPEQIAQIKADAKIQGGDIAFLVGGNLIGGGLDSAFSLGYPDTCKFKLLLQKNATGDTSLTELFTSEFCVIENVAVDYGSQNKMVFFSSGAEKKYYPSEVTVTINLREILPLATNVVK